MCKVEKMDTEAVFIGINNGVKHNIRFSQIKPLE